MSKATKRKHVAKEVLDSYILPTEDQKIVKIVGGRGNNLHEIVTEEGSNFLVSMPSKFRKNVWIKRGDFVIIQPIEEGEKVRAEICHILFPSQIRHIQSQNKWPEGFDLAATNQTNDGGDETTCEKQENTSESSLSDEDLHVNENRTVESYDYESEDSDSSIESQSESEK